MGKQAHIYMSVFNLLNACTEVFQDLHLGSEPCH